MGEVKQCAIPVATSWRYSRDGCILEAGFGFKLVWLGDHRTGYMLETSQTVETWGRVALLTLSKGVRVRGPGAA